MTQEQDMVRNIICGTHIRVNFESFVVTLILVEVNVYSFDSRPRWTQTDKCLESKAGTTLPFCRWVGSIIRVKDSYRMHESLQKSFLLRTRGDVEESSLNNLSVLIEPSLFVV